MSREISGEVVSRDFSEDITLFRLNRESFLRDGRLLLFDNVQFIYELALAQLELKSFGVEFEITNGLREFRLLSELKDVSILKKRLAYFKSIDGEFTDYFYIVRKNRTNSVNQYLTHWIYPYKGKFHPQMVRALLNIMGLRKGDVVLDPFMGSGTTAVEAQLLGIDCIGLDVSPLCVFQSKVKVESVVALPEILDWKKEVIDKVERNLFNLDNYTLDKVIESIPNEKVRNFYLMAMLVATSDNARRKREFAKAFVKNVETMILSVKDYSDVIKELSLNPGNVDIRIGDARALPLDDNSVDGIVTSPPYSIALDYVANDAHALKILGCDLKEIREKFIGVRGAGEKRIELYNKDMEVSLREMFRVLKPGKLAVLVLGNATYKGKEIKTVEFVSDYAQNIGFKLLKRIDKVIFGLYNVMQRESILIFKKE